MDNVRQLSVWKSTSVDSIKYNADFFFFFFYWHSFLDYTEVWKQGASLFLQSTQENTPTI